ncbi:MAG: ferrous iron transport protein A [Verrucomicrobiales bacterium]|nr:ferrous iron transport protein A [Verrucomicrobiales bacterium]
MKSDLSLSQNHTITETLVDLEPGDKAVISHFASSDDCFIRFRELGMLPGTPVNLVRRAPLGDPLEISVRGSLLSVRAHEAQLIEIEPRHCPA